MKITDKQKAGDIIRCIDTHGHDSLLTKGKLYTIERIDGCYHYMSFVITLDNGSLNNFSKGWINDWFEVAYNPDLTNFNLV